ncbi:hypothetical protein [Bradyrhizobium liaoningense]
MTPILTASSETCESAGAHAPDEIARAQSNRFIIPAMPLPTLPHLLRGF